jgi:hypothetical protein
MSPGSPWPSPVPVLTLIAAVFSWRTNARSLAVGTALVIRGITDCRSPGPLPSPFSPAEKGMGISLI